MGVTVSGAGGSRGAKKLIFSKVPNGSCDIPFDAQLKTELTNASYFEVLSCFGRVLSRKQIYDPIERARGQPKKLFWGKTDWPIV